MSRAVVYDTMLFFQAAALPPDRIHGTFRVIENGQAQLCMSRALLAEISDVLNRPELRAKAPSLTPQRVTALLDAIVKRAQLFDPILHDFRWPDHPDDDHLFNLAIAAQAEFLVTWETRLLKLASSRTPEAERLASLAPNLQIVTPPEFLARLSGTR
jgi:putative PIN family toxin of toxin-antitoxin system